MITNAADAHAHDRRTMSAPRFTQAPRDRFSLRIALPTFLCVALLATPIAAGDPRDAVFSLLTRMEAGYAQVADYVAVFRKQERVDGKLLPEETILLKFQKPFKAYMKWIEEPFKGTEALYVEGRNDNKLLVHRGGVLEFLTFSLDPKGTVAMKGKRHPITEVGFGFLIDMLRRNIQTALQHGEFEVIRMGDEPFRGRPAHVLEARFTPRSTRSYYASRFTCSIDKESGLPTAVAIYDKDGALFERYSYSEVRLNAGLTAQDFSRDNKAYRFGSAGPFAGEGPRTIE